VCIEVIKAEYMSEYRIFIELNNGKKGYVDLHSTLWGPAFESLKDYNQFRNFSVSPELGTVVWANGADIAAEYFEEHLVSHPDPS
jgi:hypothetical protein